MTLKVHSLGRLYAVLAVAMLAGCASSSSHAPVRERGAVEKKPVAPVVAPIAAPVSETATQSVPAEKDWRPQTYVVQKGDTLYSIAFNHGMGYQELAELNGIEKPDLIRVGQEIRLVSNAASVMSKPISMPMVETTPLSEIKPVESKAPGALIKDQPKTAKLPYSEQAVAEIEKMQDMPHKPEPVAVAKMEPKAEPRPDSTVNSTSEGDDDALEWSMPTSGKVIGEFSESANQKGIDLAGKRGQAVVASAAGKVVYSGSGLRGYGKLVIIKHNKTYLSAYAHNDQVLVKEGQTVTKGQKIAEMGNTDADQVKLHFEIRKFGKPVDPAKYLPLIKS